MKKLFLLFSSISLLAQIPKNYYASATGKGYELKTQLYKIISKHKDLGYGELWKTYKISDIDNFYENDNSVLDIYSENPTKKDPYSYKIGANQCGIYSAEGDCYNREHIIPQSSFNSASPMVSDAHFIPPTDGKVNGMRSSYPHGYVSTAKWTSKNGSKLGSSAIKGYKGTVFEPIDEFKGDIARMYFYFATCYQDRIVNFDYEMFNGTKDQVFTDAFKNLLIEWHRLDPVSKREIIRNNAIYKRQGNRNPFIDHPEWVEDIWGKAIISKEIVDNTIKTELKPKKKTIKNKISKTKISIPKTISENHLYFSAYVEGSSNNKAIVITNSSSKTIDLSQYTIKKQTNGKGNWSKGLHLKVKLASKQSISLMYNQSSLNCPNGLRLDAVELAFNGNDPIGLFFKDQLIDCIGNFNEVNTFSKNETLIRIKQNKEVIFNKKDWKILPIDSCQ